MVNKTILSANSLSVLTPSEICPLSVMDADSPLTNLDEESDTDQEGMQIITHGEIPIPSEGKKTEMYVINTNYDPDLEENKTTNYSKRGDEGFRYYYTERERLLAEVADQPKSLVDVENLVRC